MKWYWKVAYRDYLTKLRLAWSTSVVQRRLTTAFQESWFGTLRDHALVNLVMILRERHGVESMRCIMQWRLTLTPALT